MHLELNIEKKWAHKYWKFGCEYGVEIKELKKIKSEKTFFHASL